MGKIAASVGLPFCLTTPLALKSEKIFSDPNGRFIICDIETEQKCVTLATLYAPNVDDPRFFELFFDHLYDFECDEIIIGGDFNLVLNIDMDKKGGLARTHLKSQEMVKDRAAQLDLVDAWRTINPDSRKYTWRRRKPEILCRLDFFLVSQGLMCSVTSANISAGYKTDHSLMYIKIALHSNLRGPGYWKLNTSFLTDIDYVTQIRDVIKKTHEEYQDDDTVNKGLLWEMMKLKIREQSIKYATAKKVKMSRREGELEKEINFLQNFIESNEINPNEKTEISGTLEARKRELEKIIEYRTKGSILRARCRWYNEGEKNTKYFLNLEKRHFKQSAITQLKVDDENFVTTDKEILNQCEAFYGNLYSSKIDSPNGKYDHIFFEASTVKNLNQLEQDSCEGLLTKTECLKA